MLCRAYAHHMKSDMKHRVGPSLVAHEFTEFPQPPTPKFCIRRNDAIIDVLGVRSSGICFE